MQVGNHFLRSCFGGVRFGCHHAICGIGCADEWYRFVNKNLFELVAKPSFLKGCTLIRFTSTFFVFSFLQLKPDVAAPGITTQHSLCENDHTF